MSIKHPTLLLDQDKCKENISMMVNKANRLNIKLRPHFKTHQSAEIGNWFKAFGVGSCTVSSLKMAHYFYENGWNDITLAFPLNPLAIGDINILASKIRLGAVVISERTLEFLNAHLNAPLDVYIKIDTGTHRTGISSENEGLIEKLIKGFGDNKYLSFKGFLAHSGHTYEARSREQVERIHDEEIQMMQRLKGRFIKIAPELKISVGDTPSCSISENFHGVDEIRPGNFVFYDIVQYHIGSCNHHQIAVALACPVVAKHPERNEIVVHGGAVHLSRDFIQSSKGAPIYGHIVYLKDGGWTAPVGGAYVKALSQEHGIIACDPIVFNNIMEGDVIGILPVHSCLTADLMKEYLTLDCKKIEMMR